MNPTGKNVSEVKWWKWIRAPRLGTKNVRKIFYEANLLDKNFFDQIQLMKADDRTEKFAETLYLHITKKKIYITNLAKVYPSKHKTV